MPLARVTAQMTVPEHAELLPTLLRVFTPATSLGGVESLIDWRYRYDPSVSKALLRVSIGLEAFEDLAADLAQAFRRLHAAPANL